MEKTGAKWGDETTVGAGLVVGLTWSGMAAAHGDMAAATHGPPYELYRAQGRLATPGSAASASAKWLSSVETKLTQHSLRPAGSPK